MALGTVVLLLISLSLLVWSIKWCYNVFAYKMCNYCGEKHVYPSSMEAILDREDLLDRYKKFGRIGCK